MANSPQSATERICVSTAGSPRIRKNSRLSSQATASIGMEALAAGWTAGAGIFVKPNNTRAKAIRVCMTHLQAARRRAVVRHERQRRTAVFAPFWRRPQEAGWYAANGVDP